MSRPAVALGATVLVSLLVQSCSDASTAPLLRQITLQTCRSNVTWFAYQNDGSKAWTRIAEPQAGAIVHVTPRLVVAFYDPDADSRGVYIDFLTADQAAAKYNCTAVGPWRSKTVHSSVVGLASGEWAYITMTPNAIELLEQNGAFTTRMIDGAVDLVATHVPVSYTDLRVSSIIIRRALNPSDGSTLPALDFTSAEAFAPESTTVAFSGIPAGWSATARLEFSARGSIGNQLSGTTVNGQTATIYALPTGKLVSGDYYIMYANAFQPGWGEQVSVMKLYHSAPDTLSFGPVLLAPVFTTVAATPNFRFRIDLPLQAEYSAAMTITLVQGVPSRALIMTASREYIGAAAQSWSLTMPDFSRADGFSSSWGLTSEAFNWNGSVTSAPYGFSVFRDGRDGDLYRWAFGTGSH